MDNTPVEEELCLIEGNSDAPVQLGEMNRLIRQIRAYHLRPMKQQLMQSEKTLQQHIESCALNQAKIMGGIRVLTWLVSSGLGLYLLTALAKFVGWI